MKVACDFCMMMCRLNEVTRSEESYVMAETFPMVVGANDDGKE